MAENFIGLTTEEEQIKTNQHLSKMESGINYLATAAKKEIDEYKEDKDKELVGFQEEIRDDVIATKEELRELDVIILENLTQNGNLKETNHTKNWGHYADYSTERNAGGMIISTKNSDRPYFYNELRKR